MVRRCIAEGCRESDQTILSHRFPKVTSTAEKWRVALQLNRFTIDDLQKKYVVCTRHFMDGAYRNKASNSLNTTALPNMNDNSSNQRIKALHSQKSTDPVTLVPPAAEIVKKPIPLIKYLNDLFDPNPIHNLSPIKKPPIKRIKISYPPPIQSPTKTYERRVSALQELQPNEVLNDYEHDGSLSDADTEEDKVEEEPCTIVERKPAATYSEEASQTEPLPEPTVTSKDDKLISILYPGYHELSKLQLIEMLIERDKKVETLEDKVRKLELAMRNLL